MQLSEAEEFILSLFLVRKQYNLTIHVKPTLEKYTYDAAIIHMGINDILLCKNDEELKELVNNIIKIANTCQEYNIGKISISSNSNLH